MTTMLLALSLFAAPCPAFARGADGKCPAALTPRTPGTLLLTRGEAPPDELRLDGSPISLPSQHTLAPGAHELEAIRRGGATERRWLAVRPGERVTVAVSVCATGLQAHLDGRCCHPGQGSDGGVCVDAPWCAHPFSPQGDGGCELAACARGRTRGPDGVCCWPGQTFSVQPVKDPLGERHAGLCVGVPSRCPAGTVQVFDRCAPSVGFSDDDADHVSNAADQCPHELEDLDGFEDEDGCPEADNDKDGIHDPEDLCPNEAEDRDKFEDDDGCPDLDDDHDGIPDRVDQCRTRPEDVDGVDDTDGCPEAR